MKFFLTILFCYFFIQTKANSEADSEYYLFMEKECETATSENFSICEKYKKTKFQSQTKSRVVAEFTTFENNTAQNDLIKFVMPVNTCKKEDCEFCCLSSNKCGTKKQCENSKYYIKFVHGIFITLIIILFTFLIVKCYRTDCYPDQSHQDKVSNKDLQNLISLYSIIRTNRAKLQS